MTLKRSAFALALGLCLATGGLHAQTAPQIVWSVPTPSGLSNSIAGVSWSPAGGRIAVGSTDRGVRARSAANGALQWSTLQVPIGSGTADQTTFSSDSALVAAHNTGRGGPGGSRHVWMPWTAAHASSTSTSSPSSS